MGTVRGGGRDEDVQEGGGGGWYGGGPPEGHPPGYRGHGTRALSLFFRSR